MIIVIGADGFIGSRIMSAFDVQDRHHLHVHGLVAVDTAYASSSRNARGSHEDSAHLLHSWIHFPTIRDATEYCLINPMAHEESAITIINTSGTSRRGKHNDASEWNRYCTNLDIARDLSQAVEALTSNFPTSTVHLIHLSTNGLSQEREYTAYETSKLHQELLLESLVRLLDSKRVQLTIVRLSDVFGDQYFHADKIINLLVKSRQASRPLPYVQKGATVAPIHVDFVTEQILGITSRKIDANSCPVHLVSLRPKCSYTISELHAYIHQKNRFTATDSLKRSALRAKGLLRNYWLQARDIPNTQLRDLRKSMRMPPVKETLVKDSHDLLEFLDGPNE